MTIEILNPKSQIGHYDLRFDWALVIEAWDFN